MKKLPLVSVIITSYNGEKFISNCLRSVLKSTKLNYEIVFVNDGSTDTTRKKLDKYHRRQNIKIFNLKKNRGASLSRNFGVRKARGEYLTFLDVDCLIKKDDLEKLIEPMVKDKSIGMTQSLLLNPDGTIESAGHFLTFFGFPYNLDYIPATDKVFGTRTAIAMRKNLFEKIGGYDEDYLIYGEDTDLSWRVWLVGYKVHLALQSAICHLKKSSLSEKTKYRLYYEGTKNNLSNLLKNMPVKILVWMLPLHIFFLMLLTIKLLLEKRSKMAIEVLKGIFWNIINLQKTVKKRQLVRKYLVNDRMKDIMFGPLGFLSLAKKGWRWFKNA